MEPSGVSRLLFLGGPVAERVWTHRDLGSSSRGTGGMTLASDSHPCGVQGPVQLVSGGGRRPPPGSQLGPSCKFLSATGIVSYKKELVNARKTENVSIFAESSQPLPAGLPQRPDGNVIPDLRQGQS